jgi:hypothetical protein
MPFYHFTTSRKDGTRSEKLGGIELKDDAAAFEFGTDIIQDLMLGDAEQYISWVLDITEGVRVIGSMPFAKLN